MAQQSAWNEIRENYASYIKKHRDNPVVLQTDVGTGEPVADLPLQSAIQAGRGARVGGPPGPIEYQHLLELNNSLPNIDGLSAEDMSKMPIGLLDLTKVQITVDHIAYYERTYNEVAKAEGMRLPSHYKRTLELLVRSTILSHNKLSEAGRINDRTEESIVQRVLNRLPSALSYDWDWDIGDHEQNLIMNSAPIAAYVSYPLLESTAKWACRSDINIDGTVKPGQTVLNYSGSNYTGGQKCSNVGHILWNLEKKNVGDKLGDSMESFRSKVQELYSSTKGEEYGLIAGMRNSLAHGESIASVEYSVALSLISLILWNEREESE